jgi:hypothetical protein
LANLLKEPNELLRKQAIMIIASLLSESFVKFRGLLVYRLLYSLSDPSKHIRGIVECIFQRMLLRRNPACLSQIFGDAICALNGWVGHPRYNSAEGNEEFSLCHNPERRVAVYQFILSTLSREQKFTVCSQLVTVFLAAFVDEELQLVLPDSADSPCGQALHDVLALLSCQEMRICFSATSPEDELLSDESAAAGGAADAAAPLAGEAARNALSGVLRRVVCENIAPVLLQLKAMMEEKRSPFSGRLRRCLCEVLREFKDELSDLLGGDTRLVEEIAYDMKASAGLPAKLGSFNDNIPATSSRPRRPLRTASTVSLPPHDAPPSTALSSAANEQAMDRPKKRLRRLCSDAVVDSAVKSGARQAASEGAEPNSSSAQRPLKSFENCGRGQVRGCGAPARSARSKSARCVATPHVATHALPPTAPAVATGSHATGVLAKIFAARMGA